MQAFHPYNRTRLKTGLTFILAVVAERPELVMWIDRGSRRNREEILCAANKRAREAVLGHNSVDFYWLDGLKPHPNFCR